VAAHAIVGSKSVRKSLAERSRALIEHSAAMRLIGLAIVEVRNRQRAAAKENRLDEIKAAQGK